MVWFPVQFQLQIRFVFVNFLVSVCSFMLQARHSDLEANRTIPSSNGPVEAPVEALNLKLLLVVEGLLIPRLPATAAALVDPSRPVSSLRVMEQTSGPASREESGNMEGRASLRRPWDLVLERAF